MSVALTAAIQLSNWDIYRSVLFEPGWRRANYSLLHNAYMMLRRPSSSQSWALDNWSMKTGPVQIFAITSFLMKYGLIRYTVALIHMICTMNMREQNVERNVCNIPWHQKDDLLWNSDINYTVKCNKANKTKRQTIVTQHWEQIKLTWTQFQGDGWRVTCMRKTKLGLLCLGRCFHPSSFAS